ncbi:SymE family type I addiction module toxin [Pectobacterium brasiliense]|nr:SymE family type I addiction module toxin [Pectobacterium brasiliense]WJM83546.1 SymE family type I addiction module toxin [Pectobacterium brasiliense]
MHPPAHCCRWLPRQSRPQLKLSGKWLENIGFNTGQPVIVTVEHGKLLIETELRL